jgi:DNA-binding transcriptional MerR regulator
MNTFTIKDLANLSGIKAHTLRIWEQRYSFLKPSRTFTNIRYYSNADLKTILNIAILNKYGFKISHIDKMTEAEIKEKIFSLTALEAQQERVVNEMIQLMIDLEIESFEKILTQHIAAKGIEKTITHIIFAFLEKIGILWLSNHINPAQEHLVTNIIRQKLIVGIETVQTPLKSNKKILLFLPEGEYHELGLLFMYYLLKSRGVYVLYLGTNVPIKDIAYLVSHKKPDYVYCHLTTVGQSFNFEKFLHAAGTQLAGTPFVISGQLTNNYEKKILPPIIFKRSLPEVMEFISSL